MLKKIFSIGNIGNKKIIWFLGFKISIERSKINRFIYRNIKIDNKKIVFCNFHGAGYGCNSKYIANEILKRKLNYNLVWLCNDFANKDEIPSEIKTENFGSKRAIKELMSARIWIDNQRKIYHIDGGLIKKSNQSYIQTWHGSLGIKKVGLDSPMNCTEEVPIWIPSAIADAKMIDYLISNSEFENNVFKANFWNNGKIKKYGHPRNDIFFLPNNIKMEIKEKVFKELNIPLHKKALLYIPSFRDDSSLNCYNIDIDLLLESLQNKFGEEWVVIIRMHPHLKEQATFLYKFCDKVYNGSFYSDIQELLLLVIILHVYLILCFQENRHLYMQQILKNFLRTEGYIILLKVLLSLLQEIMRNLLQIF